MLEKLWSISVSVVERTEKKVDDLLHKSNPWVAESCERKGCIFCESGDKKLVRKCKNRNIVNENECLI